MRSGSDRPCRFERQERYALRETVESNSLLTDRQEWLLEEAIAHGYYDTPRRTTLVELAEEVDLAKSTRSEILHRAEERVLKEFASGRRNERVEVAATAD